MAVTIKELIEHFNLEVLVEGDKNKVINVSDINRPGLQIAGFYQYFDNKRVQVRGMAIIDIPAIYGMSSVLNTKTISILISLTLWNENEEYDRLGIDNEFMDILNVTLRKITLPIRPGRNIAVIIEA